MNLHGSISPFAVSQSNEPSGPKPPWVMRKQGISSLQDGPFPYLIKLFCGLG
jgi:hypothetical protein